MSRIPKVKGYRLLVDPKEIQEKIEGTTLDLVKVTETKEHEERNMQEGIVIQVGADCYKADACNEPWCKVGDTVLFKRGAAMQWYDESDKMYVILNEEDILATF